MDCLIVIERECIKGHCSYFCWDLAVTCSYVSSQSPSLTKGVYQSERSACRVAPRAPRAKGQPTSVMQEFYQPFKLRSEHSDTGYRHRRVPLRSLDIGAVVIQLETMAFTLQGLLSFAGCASLCILRRTGNLNLFIASRLVGTGQEISSG